MYDVVMRTFELLFPILMIGTPLTIALAVSSKPHPDYSVDEQHRRTREFTIRLSLCTLCALLLHFILWMTIPTLPGLSIVRTLSWVLFFPLWFLISVPLVQTKDPGWMSATSLQGSTRSANLHTRHAKPEQFWPYWALFLLVVAVMGTLISIAIPRLPDPIRLVQFPRVLLLLGSWLFILMAVVLRRKGILEPEPYSEHAFEEQKEEYSRFREARMTLNLLLASVVAIFLEIFALVSLTQLHPALLFGWGGGIAGFTLGSLGAAIGIWSSFKRAKLNRMLIQESIPKEA